MLQTRGYAVKSAAAKFEPFRFERREPGVHDVLIEILYCGICHTDIHQARDEWGGGMFPMVPGHEIVGRVTRVGPGVTKFKAGDLAGVGCFVDSCRACRSCREGEEQFCEEHVAFTYSGLEMDRTTPTQGGYSSQIVVDENYVLRIPENLPLPNAAPLLCAGITTYSPLRRFRVGPGSRVGVVGLGGLGHMAVKLAAAMGAHVTVFSTSQGKEEDAMRLGAHHFVVTGDPVNVEPLANSLDVIIDAVSAAHDLNQYLNLLRRDGALVQVGAPAQPSPVHAFMLLLKRRTLTGSLIGGIRETQEMLDFCGANHIAAEVEVIPVQKIDEAFERTLRSDVRYRFVIDLKTL